MKGVRSAIKEAGISKSGNKDVTIISQDIKNAPDQAIGNHGRCREFCTKKESLEVDHTKTLYTNFLSQIRTLVGNVER